MIPKSYTITIESYPISKFTAICKRKESKPDICDEVLTINEIESFQHELMSCSHRHSKLQMIFFINFLS